MTKFLFLGVGSVLGGYARYFLAGSLYKALGTNYPFGTLAVNLLGCFLIGYFSGLSGEKMLFGANGYILLVAGFCGAFTTFSTFMLEADSLIQLGQSLRALSYIVLSCVVGFVVFRLGVFLAKLA